MTITEQARAAAEEVGDYVASLLSLSQAPLRQFERDEIAAIIIKHVHPASCAEACKSEFEAKLLGFGDDDRVKLCARCLLQAIEDNLVIFSSGIPLGQQPASVTEAIEEVKRLRNEWYSEARRLRGLAGWTATTAKANAAEQIITALSALQGKAGVSEPCAFCDHSASDHARGQMRRTEPCEAPDCDCGNYAATTPASVEAPLASTGTIWKPVEAPVGTEEK